MGRLKQTIQSVSVAGTGSQRALLALSRVIIWNIALYNNQSTHAEAAIIGIYPEIMTEATADLTGRFGGEIIGGHAGLYSPLTWTGPLKVEGQITISGWVYHDASVAHEMRVVVENLD